MSKNPLEIIQKNDPQFFENFQKGSQLSFTDGVLSKKTKLLIGMAIDATLGTEEGVKSLAKQAMEAGATKEEIMETARVIGFIAGAKAVFTTAYGLDGVI